MAITSASSTNLARQFLEMADNNLDTAISLFFENGGNNAAPSMQDREDEDSELAQKLQNEAYQEPEVRPPDEARHETLAGDVTTHVFPGRFGGVGGAFQPLNRVSDMFDTSVPAGVFNQRFEDAGEDDYGKFESDSDDDDDDDDDEDDDDEYEYVEESTVDIGDDGNLRESTKLVRRPKYETKAQKLANLFKPPFKMMSKLNLEGAKLKARRKNKWIMINIQDTGIFQCQVLNRDLWSSKEVRKLIKKNFIFLQYQYESRNAEPYLNFYPLVNKKDDLPHIAILDPITGERVKQWNQEVPKPDYFISEILKFLTDYSLDPTGTNPTVKEPTPEIDPTTLSEEQQLEFAIKQSLGQSADKPISVDDEEEEDADGDVNMDNTKSETASEVEEAEEKHLDAFDTIKPIKHDEPANKPGITTRIQIRTGDGKRIVKRFNAMEDSVRTLYEVVKSEIEGYDTCRFTLSNHLREDLINKLDMSISDAGLKNSSLLLEKYED